MGSLISGDSDLATLFNNFGLFNNLSYKSLSIFETIFIFFIGSSFDLYGASLLDFTSFFFSSLLCFILKLFLSLDFSDVFGLVKGFNFFLDIFIFPSFSLEFSF